MELGKAPGEGLRGDSSDFGSARDYEQLGQGASDAVADSAAVQPNDFEPQQPEGTQVVPLSQGGEVWMNAERYRRYEAAGVEPELFLRHERIQHDADLITKMLDGSDLAAAMGHALKVRSADVLRVAREVREGSQTELTEAEVARAQRDLEFLLGAMTVALGARSYQEGAEQGIYTRMTSGKKMGRGRYA